MGATPAVEEGTTTTHVKRNARASSDHPTATSEHKKRLDEPDRLTGGFPKPATSLDTGSLVPKQSSMGNGTSTSSRRESAGASSKQCSALHGIAVP